MGKSKHTQKNYIQNPSFREIYLIQLKRIQIPNFYNDFFVYLFTFWIYLPGKSLGLRLKYKKKPKKTANITVGIQKFYL